MQARFFKYVAQVIEIREICAQGVGAFHELLIKPQNQRDRPFAPLCRVPCHHFDSRRGPTGGVGMAVEVPLGLGSKPAQKNLRARSEEPCRGFEFIGQLVKDAGFCLQPCKVSQRLFGCRQPFGPITQAGGGDDARHQITNRQIPHLRRKFGQTFEIGMGIKGGVDCRAQRLSQRHPRRATRD